jgi:hypothetical protein
MILESMESFVGQLVMHKYNCKSLELVEIANHQNNCNYYSIKCFQCKMVWDIKHEFFAQTSFRYVRGGDKAIFYQFVMNTDCSKHLGSSYEDLFAVFSVMCC